MVPSCPKFDWLGSHKNEDIIFYETGEVLAEVYDDGLFKWFYRDGKVALDFIDVFGKDVLQYLLSAHICTLPFTKEMLSTLNLTGIIDIPLRAICILETSINYSSKNIFIYVQNIYKFSIPQVVFSTDEETNATKEFIVYDAVTQNKGRYEDKAQILASFDDKGHGVVYDRFGYMRSVGMIFFAYKKR